MNSNSLFDSSVSDHIYYNLKIANIDNNTTIKSKPFYIKDDTSQILNKQSDYEMAIQSFRLNLALPLFLFPIAEGFVDYLPNQNLAVSITQANPCVITGSVPHGLQIGDAVRIIESEGMTEINGDYFITATPSASSFQVSNIEGGIPIDSSSYSTYISSTALIQKINDNYNRTNFAICLSHAGVDYAEVIEFIPDKNLVINPSIIPKTPKENDGLQDNSTFYYYSYSFDVFCKAINNSLINATIRVNTATPNTLDYPPMFQYRDGKFELVWDFKMNTNSVEMFCNNSLLQYLQGFRTEFQGYNNLKHNHKDFKFIIQNDWTNNYSFAPAGRTIPAWSSKTTPSDPEFLRFTQEWDARYKFDEIVGILILSDYIKCRQEYYPKIGNPNSINRIGRSNNAFNTGTLNIIASFDLIDSSNNVAWREVLHYQPFEYKWIDLISDDPLQKMDAKVYFETSRGNLIQAYIPVSSQSNIRFLFRHKHIEE